MVVNYCGAGVVAAVVASGGCGSHGSWKEIGER